MRRRRLYSSRGEGAYTWAAMSFTTNCERNRHRDINDEATTFHTRNVHDIVGSGRRCCMACDVVDYDIYGKVTM